MGNNGVILSGFVMSQCESISSCSIRRLRPHQTVQQPSFPAARQVHHHIRHDPGDRIGLQKALRKLTELLFNSYTVL